MTTVADVVSAVVAGGGELRAGGTDVMARRLCGRASTPFVDLADVAGLTAISWLSDGSAQIGAMTPVAAVAAELATPYPALALTAAALATPQIRAAGTVGGNLLQRNRCWYYRNPAFSCHQTGGSSCPARSGIHLYSVVIDKSPCAAPHPSSLAMALLVYDAVAEVHGRGALAVQDLYDTSPDRDHVLSPGEVLTSVSLPGPLVGERAAYHRATARSGAEWPLVEAVARLVIVDSVVTVAAIAVGGVARTPLRLPAVEAALAGTVATPETLAGAASLAAAECAPLPQTGYKVGLLRDTVLEVLEQAAAIGGSA